jgi:glycosyltransferase involved in cell wall biosynthesis
MSAVPSYVLITPARNEAEYIELTVKSVVAQTARPLKWVIVSDGSTDGTDDIVQRYISDCPWIELVRMPERRERHFAGKVHAFNAGYARVADLDYKVIGNLDADVEFDSDYFDFLLRKFSENPRLGVAGTPFKERSSSNEEEAKYDYRFTSSEHVSGQAQMFRRECFEDIGGYIPRRLGGIDLVAVTTARMKGWETRSFLEKTYFHHRPMSTANQSIWMVPFRGGRSDYLLGSHPVWHLFRCIYQGTRQPFLLGGCLRFAGFVWAMVTRAEIQVSSDFIQFRRREQMHRLWRFVTRS